MLQVCSNTHFIHVGFSFIQKFQIILYTKKKSGKSFFIVRPSFLWYILFLSRDRKQHKKEVDDDDDDHTQPTI